MAQTSDWQALKGLQRFVSMLVKSRVRDRDGFKRWLSKPGNEEAMADCFGFVRTGKMPGIGALVKPHFHPELPLIGLNYTNVAHNTLHAFPNGWTPAVRLCRGIILDRKAKLVALPFKKFFNFGEHPETKKLPRGSFVVTEKMDGHLGIIFEYGGKLVFATRASFDGPTAKLGNEMLKKRARQLAELRKMMRHVTLLVETIHPKTRVKNGVDYGDSEDLVIIGAMGRESLHDFEYHELVTIGEMLKLPVTKRWGGKTVADLRAFMKDRSVANREGFVVRFESGLRVKFKFETYIGKMVEGKLSYTYLMNRLLAGTLTKMVDTLDFESRGRADEMVAAIRKAKGIADKKVRHEYLYKLDAEKEKNAYYRGICRKYAASL